MSSNDVFKARRGKLELVDDRPTASLDLNIFVVVFGSRDTRSSSVRRLVAWLVEVRFGDENERLDGHKDLQNGGALGIPLLVLRAAPSAQQ